MEGALALSIIAGQITWAMFESAIGGLSAIGTQSDSSGYNETDIFEKRAASLLICEPAACWRLVKTYGVAFEA
jgi:hypothetical protein